MCFMETHFNERGKNGYSAAFFHSHLRQTDGEKHSRQSLRQKSTSFSGNHILTTMSLLASGQAAHGA